MSPSAAKPPPSYGLLTPLYQNLGRHHVDELRIERPGMVLLHGSDAAHRRSARSARLLRRRCARIRAASTPRARPAKTLPVWWAPNGIADLPTAAIDPPHRAASPAVPAFLRLPVALQGPCLATSRLSLWPFQSLPRHTAIVNDAHSRQRRDRDAGDEGGGILDELPACARSRTHATRPWLR